MEILAKEFIKMRQHQVISVVDVREPWECACAPFPDAIEIPLGQLIDEEPTLPTGSMLITLCHHGVRSLNAARYLREKGFDAFSLKGGIDLWSRQIDPSIPRY